MSASVSYPPKLTLAEEEHLANVIIDWTISHGLCIRPPPSVFPLENDPKSILGCHVPVTLFPSRFPKECFKQAEAVQKTYNDLYIKISRDEKFLEEIVKEVQYDDFTVNLWKVHEKVKKEGYIQPLSLGLFRSDYLIHENTSGSNTTLQAKQVEFNTISVSFGGLSTKTSKLHYHLATTEYPLLANAPIPFTIPLSPSASSLAAGLRAAHNAYSTHSIGPYTSNPLCILFITQDGERNVFDQRAVEYHLTTGLPSDGPAIPTFRLPISQIQKHTVIDTTNTSRALVYTLPANSKLKYEVSVVYFRCAYDPSDYPGPETWEARYHLERSAAIKCPTIFTQLAGCKKVQQVLATPRSSPDETTVLGKYINEDAAEAKLLRETFTNIYPMDRSPAGLKARELALNEEKCQAFVLKPQREGGGNNIYRGAIPGYLKSVPEETWGSYILMELITPPPVNNIILRNGHIEKGGVICELGVYGTAVWNQNSGEIIHNEEAGYLLRTKGDKSEEGGVAAGFGCMDSVSLV